MRFTPTRAATQLNPTVAGKKRPVKASGSKHVRRLLGVFAGGWVAAIAFQTTAVAEDANARMVLNATHLTNYVNGVIPDTLPYVISNLKNNTIKRIAPEQPVWILSADTGFIVYYQGQPEFERKEAALLVDDAGQRFGLKAVQNARNSKNTWLAIVMAGQTYKAYCANLYPYVVCSLNPQGTPLAETPEAPTPPAAPAK